MTTHARTRRMKDRRGERGTVMVIAALAMTALLLFAALAIDVGLVWSSRTQSQNVADAAALAAASKMIAQSGSGPPSVDLVGAQKEGNKYGGLNSTVGVPSVNVREGDATGAGGDFTFGNWDLETRTFTELSGAALDDFNQVRAVRATVLMDDAVNKQSPSFLSNLIGRYGFDVKNEATAYLGFAGQWGGGDFDLPVAIDGCDIGGTAGECGTDYCAAVSSPPNPCPTPELRWPQGETNVTCLEFSSTPEQNACWTAYDGGSSSVNTPVLEGIIDNGNPDDFEAGDEAYLDNGEKEAALMHLRNRFYGCNNAGKNCGNGVSGSPQQRGFDRYGPNPAGSPATAPAIDSWVVMLPVFECQPGTNCSGGTPFKINGGVCFEIREILSSGGDYGDSLHKIKGRFLCPDSDDATEVALFNQYCRDAADPGPGGCNWGISAKHVVLVE